MSKAGPSLLRATLFRAASTARRQDPQLARISYQQVTERGASHLKASCVVAGHLAERTWTVLSRGTPYVVCDNNGSPVTAEQARQIIAEKWTVSEEVRKRRRSRKMTGKAPQPAATGPDRRGDLPRPRSSRPRAGQSTPSPDQPASISPPAPPSTATEACAETAHTHGKQTALPNDLTSKLP